MEKHETKSKKASDKQVGSLLGFASQIMHEIFSNMTAKDAIYWLGNKSFLKKKLRETFNVAPADPLADFSKIIIGWQRFYKEVFDLEVDFSDIVIPLKPGEILWRLIIIPKGLTLNVVVMAMKKKFKVEIFANDLDKAVLQNSRNPDENYAIWVRDGIGPDQEYLERPVSKVDKEGKIGMTLLERLVFELKHFSEKSGHLDTEGRTHCAGSRTDGLIPAVYWSSGRQAVCISTFDEDFSTPFNGLRLAVAA